MNVLLMFSGGRDSLLSACRILENKDYNLKLVTYDNGCIMQVENVYETSDKLIERFGSDRVEHIGIFKTIGIAREFFMPYFNMKPSEQNERFGSITPSQVHCLICKTAMYIYSMWLAAAYDCKIIANGDRKSQEFVIEQNNMHKKYQSLISKFANNKYKLELLSPVHDLDDDWERDNEILRYGLSPKVLEPKCMIGCPINDSIDSSVCKAIEKYYEFEIMKRIEYYDFLSEDNIKKYVLL